MEILPAIRLRMIMAGTCKIIKVSSANCCLRLVCLSARCTEGFDSLADLIASYPLITRNTHFVFVPGPLDIAVNCILPRRPLLSSLVHRLKAKIPKVHFATNPCRIKFFNQEIVVFREDLMARMLRNIVGVKPNARSEDLKRFVRAMVPSSSE